LLLLIPVVAGVLPQALAEGLSTVKGIGASNWIAILPLALLAALAVWLARRDQRTWAVATVVASATLAVVYMKTAMFPDLDRVVSARPIWLQIREHPEQFCEGDLNRALRYGLAYYHGKPLEPCNVNPTLRRLDR
jgi:hypothetical protein